MSKESTPPENEKSAPPDYVKNFKDIAKGNEDKNPIFQSELEIINKARKQKESGKEGNPDEKSKEKKNDKNLAASTRYNLVGLALSGGGIRSATFNLGLLQSLCCNKMMKRVDYLSTVSGGGYIGSCLTTLLNSRLKEDLLDIENFPFSNRAALNGNGQADKPDQSTIDNSPQEEECKADKEKEPVRHLRYYSTYLIAAEGFIRKYFRPLMVFLRGVVLNFLLKRGDVRAERA